MMSLWFGLGWGVGWFALFSTVICSWVKKMNKVGIKHSGFFMNFGNERELICGNKFVYDCEMSSDTKW